MRRSRMASTSAVTSTGRTWTTSSGRGYTAQFGLIGVDRKTLERTSSQAGGCTRESRPQTASTRLHEREPQISGDRVNCDHPQLGAPAVLAWGMQHAAIANRRCSAGRRRCSPSSRFPATWSTSGSCREPRRAELLGVWCGPCVEEAGVLGQAFREGQGNVRYVGADNRDTDSRINPSRRRILTPIPRDRLFSGATSRTASRVSRRRSSSTSRAPSCVVRGSARQATLNHYIELITR